MKYQVVKTECDKTEIAPNGSNLSLSEAEFLLDDLHLLELCQVNTIVSPIITLWHSTKLSAFAVSCKDRHYAYRIAIDRFAEMNEILKPICQN